MTNIPAKMPNFDLPFGEDLKQIMIVCEQLAKTKFYEKIGGSAGILSIYLASREMRLPFMFCLNGGMHIVQGRVMVAANTMASMILNAGHNYKIIEMTDKQCVIKFIRSDRPAPDNHYVHTFTIEDAKKARLLNKDNWQMYPKAMLFARCMSAGSKVIMPDVMMGAYVFGEIPNEDEEINAFCKEMPIYPEIDEIPQENGENVQNSNENDQDFSQNVENSNKIEGFEDFEKKLLELDKAPMYIDQIMKKSGWTKEQVIERAMKNQAGFMQKLNEWCSSTVSA